MKGIGIKFSILFLFQIFIIKEKIMTQKIKIKEQEYELKYTVRVLFVYERITGKSFDPTKLFDLYMYFYSCLVANNQNFSMLVDEFIDECDNNPGIFEEFLNFFQRAIQFQNQTASKDEVTEDNDKKKE